MDSSALDCYSRVVAGRRPLILIGDSNEAQGYNYADDADSSVRRFQTSGAEWAHRNYCHQGHGETTYWSIRDDVGPMGPMPSGSGVLRTHYMLDLGLSLAERGVFSTVLSFAVGSSSFDLYSPTLNPANYATRLAWIRRGLAQMPQHQAPILVTGQGMAGVGSVPYVEAQNTLVAALRSDLGYPSMPVVVIRAPATAGYTSFGEYQALIDAENAYAAQEPLCSLAYNDVMEYVNDTTNVGGQVHGVHFDGPSGRRLAIGPDDAQVRSILAALTGMV